MTTVPAVQVSPELVLGRRAVDQRGRSAAMRASLLSLALACIAVSGCSRSDDLGVEIVNEVVSYGGRAQTNGTLPKLKAQWTVKRDRNGFQASVTGANFAEVDILMRRAFGTPIISNEGSQTGSGQPHRVWGAVDIGAAIQLMGRTNGVDIICVRAMSDMTEMFREMDRPWWRFW